MTASLRELQVIQHLQVGQVSQQVSLGKVRCV